MAGAADKNDVLSADILWSAEASTRDRLIAAALTEFNDKGWLGTDTNRIARAAGFAPQTFYRHFKDKTDIFLAAHDACMRAEYRAIDAVAEARRDDYDLAIADIIIGHHGAWRRFYKAMKLLSESDQRIHARRVESLGWKLKRVRHLPGNEGRSEAELIADLFAIERLCDAVIDGEFEGAGVSAEAARGLVAAAVAKACGGRL
jgi:AcrR family transcriptional regulator